MVLFQRSADTHPKILNPNDAMEILNTSTSKSKFQKFRLATVYFRREGNNVAYDVSSYCRCQRRSSVNTFLTFYCMLQSHLDKQPGSFLQLILGALVV